jgi:hypothetical protein
MISLSTTFDFDTEKQYTTLDHRPQWMPVSLPIRGRALPLTVLDNHPLIEIPVKKQHLIIPLKNTDYTSFTKITRIYSTKPKTRFQIRQHENETHHIIVPNIHEMIHELEQQGMTSVWFFVHHRFLYFRKPYERNIWNSWSTRSRTIRSARLKTYPTLQQTTALLSMGFSRCEWEEEAAAVFLSVVRSSE